MPVAFCSRKCLGSHYPYSIQRAAVRALALQVGVAIARVGVAGKNEPQLPFRTFQLRTFQTAVHRNKACSLLSEGLRRKIIARGHEFPVLAKRWASRERTVENEDHVSSASEYEYTDRSSAVSDEGSGSSTGQARRTEARDNRDVNFGTREEDIQIKEPKFPKAIPYHKGQSTITDAEKETFARLFEMATSGQLDAKKKVAKGSDKPQKTDPPETPDVYASANEKLDNEMERRQAIRWMEETARTIPGERMNLSGYPEALRPLVMEKGAELVLKRRYDEERKQRLMPAGEVRKGQTLDNFVSTPISELGDVNPRFAEIVKRMSEATTDKELWEVLQKEVLSDFIALEKAGVFERQKIAPAETSSPAEESSSDKTPKKSKKEKRGKKKAKVNQKEKEEVTKELPDVDTFRTNYPLLLVAAVQQFRRDYPNSLLSLSVLAEVKRLGRVSYALGASTALHNESLSLLWSTYTDLDMVDKLLHEMDVGGIDFDGQTLFLLNEIHGECMAMAQLPPNKPLGFIWRMERSMRGIGLLEKWQGVVKQRLEAEAIRMVRLAESDAAMGEGAD